MFITSGVKVASTSTVYVAPTIEIKIRKKKEKKIVNLCNLKKKSTLNWYNK